VDLRLEIRNVLVQLGDFPRIRERLQEAETLATQLGDDRRRGRVYTVLTNCHELMGEMPEAVAAGTQALALAQQLDDLPLRLQATKHLAQAYQSLGEHERAVAMIQGNLASLPPEAVDERFGESAPVSVYDRVNLVNSLSELGRFAEAVELAAEALQIAARTGHAFTIGFAHLGSTWLYTGQGDWLRGLAHAEQGLMVLRASHVLLSQQALIVLSAWMLAQLGRTTEAMRRIQEGEEFLERWSASARGAARGLAPRTTLARAWLLLDQPEEAGRLMAPVREAGQQFRGIRAAALRQLGDLALHPRQFEPAAAARYYTDALALAEALKLRPLVAHCHAGLARLHRRTGEPARAHEHLTLAAALYREMAMHSYLESAEERGP